MTEKKEIAFIYEAILILYAKVETS